MVNLGLKRKLDHGFPLCGDLVMNFGPQTEGSALKFPHSWHCVNAFQHCHDVLYFDR